MEEYILNECRKRILKFHNMSDIEIYNWMCDNYKGCSNYEMIRKCSFIIFEESRQLKSYLLFLMQQTENNKADANKSVCLIYWKGEQNE